MEKQKLFLIFGAGPLLLPNKTMEKGEASIQHQIFHLLRSPNQTGREKDLCSSPVPNPLSSLNKCYSCSQEHAMISARTRTRRMDSKVGQCEAGEGNLSPLSSVSLSLLRGFLFLVLLLTLLLLRLSASVCSGFFSVSGMPSHSHARSPFARFDGGATDFVRPLRLWPRAVRLPGTCPGACGSWGPRVSVLHSPVSSLVSRRGCGLVVVYRDG
jgi:hypothetical protein